MTNFRNPFSAIALCGESTMRGVTLALPKERVRDFLPAGLELGSQSLTPDGTHPVLYFFNDIFRLSPTIPSLLPSLPYHEHQIGVPFVYLSGNSMTPGGAGPYYFMPTLYLDQLFPVLGGVFWYGFAKTLGLITVSDDAYTVKTLAGERVSCLECKDGKLGGYVPERQFRYFDPIREILSQTLISYTPWSLGPFFMLTDFVKDWDNAVMRPLQTAMVVDVAYVPGHPCGRNPEKAFSQTIADSTLGSYELRVQWRLSLPYPPLFAFP